MSPNLKARPRRLHVSYLTYYAPSHDETPVACYIVPFNDAMRCPHYAKRLASIIVDLGLSRREVAKLINAIICDYRYQFYWPGGQMRCPFYEDEVGRAFGGDESFRWLSDFYLRAFLPVTGKTLRLREGVLSRVRLLTLVAMVTKPEEARLLFLRHS